MLLDNFGVAIFDNEYPKGAWACIDGGNPFRIESINDLPKTVFWWTSLGKSVASIRNKEFVNIKHADYIRPNMQSLLKELGLSSSSQITLQKEIPQCAKAILILSEIFSRLMRFSMVVYGVKQLNSFSFSTDLYEEIVGDEILNNRDLNECMKEAYSNFVSCDASVENETILFNVKRLRIDHALDVLSTPIPNNKWEFVPGKVMPSHQDRIDWILSKGLPFLANIHVHDIDAEFSSMIPFSGDGKKNSIRNRNWVSEPELINLVKYADVEVKNIWLGDGYQRVPMHNPMLTLGNFGRLSISIGILCENYLSTMCSTRATRQYGEEKQEYYSPRSVWLTAVDRQFMLINSKILTDEGFSVRSYGKGCVNVAVKKSDLLYFKQVCSALRLNIDLGMQSHFL